MPTSEDWDDPEALIGLEPPCPEPGCDRRMTEESHRQLGGDRFEVTYICGHGHRRTTSMRVDRPQERWPASH